MGKQGKTVLIPAYALQPEEWRQFLIPHFIVQTLNIDARYGWVR